MIKGTGGAVLDALLRERILSLDGKWYILNTDILGERLGVHYVDCTLIASGRLLWNL